MKHLLGIADLSTGRHRQDPRSRRDLRRDQHAADQEGADPARQDRDQPVPRGLDAHAHLVRDRRQAPVGRRHQHLGLDLVDHQGRDAARHRQEPAGDGARRHRPAPRRRRARRTSSPSTSTPRSSTPATAPHEHPTQALLDCAHHPQAQRPRQFGFRGAHGRHRRRHRALAGGALGRAGADAASAPACASPGRAPCCRSASRRWARRSSSASSRRSPAPTSS